MAIHFGLDSIVELELYFILEQKEEEKKKNEYVDCRCMNLEKHKNSTASLQIIYCKFRVYTISTYVSNYL